MLEKEVPSVFAVLSKERLTYYLDEVQKLIDFEDLWNLNGIERCLFDSRFD